MAQSAANTKLTPVQRARRLYYILEFISFKDEKSFYDVRKEVENLYSVVQEKRNLSHLIKFTQKKI